MHTMQCICFWVFDFERMKKTQKGMNKKKDMNFTKRPRKMFFRLFVFIFYVVVVVAFIFIHFLNKESFKQVSK